MTDTICPQCGSSKHVMNTSDLPLRDNGITIGRVYGYVCKSCKVAWRVIDPPQKKQVKTTLISRIRGWLLKRKILKMNAVEFTEEVSGTQLQWYQRIWFSNMTNDKILQNNEQGNVLKGKKIDYTEIDGHDVSS